jgi:aminoglycoside phosphotransferase (APT) family kinase protein
MTAPDDSAAAAARKAKGVSTGERRRTLDPDNLAPLIAWLTSELAATRVTVTEAVVLHGGAVQENWRLEVECEGGAHPGRHSWVLRTDAAARIPLSIDRASEFAVLQAAHRAGVPVAEPIARCPDPRVIGAPFLIQRLAPGVAQGRRIVRDPRIAAFGPSLAEDLGRALARIHAMTPSSVALPALTLPIRPAAHTEVQRLRAALDTSADARPALEYVLSWLDRNAPERRPLALVHGDFRTGNYLVDDGRLIAVLDWEFAHWGDPAEDIGWLCARCWRFGADTREVGGIADREPLYRGYDSVSEEPLDRRVVPFWEIFALAKWATVAVLQGDRYRSGGETALELALTGLMPPEMELDALDLIESIEAQGGVPWR